MRNYFHVCVYEPGKKNWIFFVHLSFYFKDLEYVFLKLDSTVLCRGDVAVSA